MPETVLGGSVMPKFDRRYKGETTHTLDGASRLQTIGVFILVVGVGALFWLVQKLRIRNLFWWGLRLHFLTQTDEVLRYYGIQSPAKERAHARFTGLCMGSMPLFALLSWMYPTEHLWPIFCAMSLVGYVYLTTIYFLNERDNPTAYALDVRDYD